MVSRWSVDVSALLVQLYWKTMKNVEPMEVTVTPFCCRGLVANPLVRLLFDDAENKLYESVSGLSGQVTQVPLRCFASDFPRWNVKELLEMLNFKNRNSDRFMELSNKYWDFVDWNQNWNFNNFETPTHWSINLRVINLGLTEIVTGWKPRLQMVNNLL